MKERLEANQPAEQDPYYPAMTDPDDGGVGVRAIISFIRRRKGQIALVALLGTAIAGFYGFTRIPKYTAQAMVVIEPKEARVIDVQAVAAGLSTESSTVETQVRIFSSYAMLDLLVDRLNLVDPDSPHSMAAQSSFLDMLAAWVPENLLVATGLAHEEPKFEPEAKLTFAKGKMVDELQKNLKIRQEGRSLVLSVNYTHPDAEYAAWIANGLADLYVRQQVDDKTKTTRRAVDWLEIRVAELQEQTVQAESEAEAYRSKHGLYENRGMTLQSQQIMNLTNMLVEARAARSEKESRLRYIKEMQAKKESLFTLSEVMDSPYMEKLWEQERQLQQTEAELLNTYGEKHPKVALNKVELAKITDKIAKEVQRIIENTSNEIKVLGAREQSVQSDIKNVMGQADSSGVAEVKLRELERQATANRALYENFLQRYKETREQLQLTEANARVVSRATPPDEPSSVPPVFVLLAGFMLSSGVGTGIAMLRERLDSTIKSGKDVERLYGIPCLALVPHLPASIMKKHGGKPHGYLLAKPLSVYSETIRSIFTALRMTNIDNPPKVIHLTSSVPSEGKTTTSVSLATSLAHYGHKVILVDLDIRHPSVGVEVGTKERGKLVEFMVGDVGFDDLIYHHDECGIDLITIGRQSSNPGAILGSKKMRELMAYLREQYDYVILDSTPVLGVTDCKLTAELADITLFVIRWEKTTSDTAEDAVKDLKSHKANLAGAIVTQVNMQKHAKYGYGGLDHYYSKYQKYYVN